MIRRSQCKAAKELGILEEYIFIERASGKDFKRPEYQLMKRMFRDGDVLYIPSLDRLGRNKQMILDEWRELIKVKHIDIVVLDMPLLNTMKYKNLNGIESLISDLIKNTRTTRRRNSSGNSKWNKIR